MARIFALRSRSRAAIDLLIEKAWAAVSAGQHFEIVTGNNDADAVYLLRWIERNHGAEKAAHVRAHLEAWGGNSSGVGVANIDDKVCCLSDPGFRTAHSNPKPETLNLKPYTRASGETRGTS